METEPATAEDWELIAKETLKQYFNRGGYGNGNNPQLLEGSNFINTIGYSLSLLPNVSMQNWTADHYRLAREGSLYYYEGKNLEAIEKIVNKLRENCNGSREVFVTILPISFFYSGSLFTLPLYRFKPRHDEKVEHFMDHTGRVYADFEDWKSNNTLPAVEILYPKNGELKINSEGKPECVLENSAECSRPVKTLLACDIASGTLGILAGIGATVATGGTALLLMGAVAASGAYGAGRTGFKIRDRVKHNETVNPFKNSEAFWLWLGLGADIVTFGTLSLASTKLLSTFSQSTAIIDISRKFGAATRAMSIFSGTLRPISDTSKALLTGYELFSKLRHKSATSTLKLPKEALIQLNDALDEFSEANMLMMAITEGYWSKSKMSYCSPEEFLDMVHQTIISHMSDVCNNKKLFEQVKSQLQNDAALIQVYKHLDTIDLDHCIEIICDVFDTNDDKMEIKLVGNAFEMKLNKFHLSIKALANLSKEERCNIVKRLQNLTQDQETKLLTIQDYANNNQDLVRIMNSCDALDMIEVWYDLFVICFDEHFVTIINQEMIAIRQFEISLKTLKSFPRDERLNIIFELKKLTESQSSNLKKLIDDSVDAESIYRMLAFDDDGKFNLIASLDEM